jgi:radical SAM superfamily enzyme YgiQ (UPF0313 family)
MNILLINTYDLGHQPFGLASPARWLAGEGATVRCLDLAVEMPSDDLIAEAGMVAIYIPMHTATRLAVPVARRVKDVNPAAHLCFYGLYAPMNERFLRGLGADSVLGGEFEEGMTALARQLAARSGQGTITAPPVTALARQQFLVPDRRGLPGLEQYAHLVDATGRRKRIGYTEATRGCKHLCRHCPIVPVYGGQFRVVQPDVVLGDIENLIAGGAEHISFGDPDFLNGPRHALDVVTALHQRFPGVTYDVIIKVEHLVKSSRHLQRLRETGCILVTCAVESFDERVLAVLDKRHTKDDFEQAMNALRSLGIPVNPTFVAFTPWTSLESYLNFLESLRDFGLVPSISPVQYAIRLLIPQGSRLLELPETRELIGSFDEALLAYQWSHPDPRMDELQRQVMEDVQAAQEGEADRAGLFMKVMRLALRIAGRPEHVDPPRADLSLPAVPRVEEPWYCCAEPTEQQLLQISGIETGS